MQHHTTQDEPEAELGQTNLAQRIVGLAGLRRETDGDARVRVAALDGPVELGHPALAGARIEQADVLVLGEGDDAARAHGTRVLGALFAQPTATSLGGVCPGCTGVSIPIFGPDDEASTSCTDGQLATAIHAALDRGAHVINISAGRPWDERGDEGLETALARCERTGVLVTASAGNEGEPRPQLPAAFPWVLAIGATDLLGEPARFSNWGRAYAGHGLVAPGQGLRLPTTDGGWRVSTGTSYASPIVAGVAALLLSIQLADRGWTDPVAVRQALLRGADPCPHRNVGACHRFLAGVLNVRRSTSLIRRKKDTMTQETTTPMAAEPVAVAPSSLPDTPAASFGPQVVAQTPRTPTVDPDALATVRSPVDSVSFVEGLANVQPSDCGCGGGSEAAPPQLVFALGSLSYDFGSEARHDSFAQRMGGDPRRPGDLLSHLDANEHAASRMLWTLNLEQTPLYVVAPNGPFAERGYARLREVLASHAGGHSERVAIAGAIAGRVTLQSGQEVPVVVPEIGSMWDWTTDRIVSAVQTEEDDPAASGHLHNFLQRVYFEVRNAGATAEERAMNFAATNAFQAQQVFSDSARDSLELDSIDVKRSPLCRPGSECFDVHLSFFNPQDRMGQARRIYRLTVDVSDVVPVTVGEIRRWSAF